MNLASRFAEAVSQFPDRPALSDDSGTLTYRQWDARARAAAHYRPPPKCSGGRVPSVTGPAPCRDAAAGGCIGRRAAATA